MCVNIVIVTLPCAWVEVSVHSRSAPKGPAHWCHDTHLGIALVAVLPEGQLLIKLGGINVHNEVKVWPGGYAMIVKSNQDSSGPGLTTGDLTNRVLAGFGGEEVSDQCV